MTILAAMGKWNAVYGEPISGTRAGPIAPRAWGVTTAKGDRVYLHLLNWADRLLTVPALSCGYASPTLGDAELPNPLRRANLMGMPITVPTFTVDDLEQFPDDGNRYELLDGVLLVSPGAELPHQVVTGRLFVLLADFLRPWPELLITSPGAIILRWEAVQEHLLAVETASRSTVIYDRDFKRPAYLDLGVGEVWRVDLDQEAILVSRPGEPADLAHRDEFVWAPKGLPSSLPIEVQPLFRGLA